MAQVLSQPTFNRDIAQNFTPTTQTKELEKSTSQVKTSRFSNDSKNNTEKRLERALLRLYKIAPKSAIKLKRLYELKQLEPRKWNDIIVSPDKYVEEVAAYNKIVREMNKTCKEIKDSSKCVVGEAHGFTSIYYISLLDVYENQFKHIPLRNNSCQICTDRANDFPIALGSTKKNMIKVINSFCDHFELVHIGTR